MGSHEAVKWSEDFECGIAAIDEQHKGLLELINEMFNHATGDPEKEQEYFKKVVEKAVNYVKTHFATEEKIMQQTKFVGFEEHKKAHETFVVAVLNNARAFQKEKKINLEEFTRFLKEWVLTHVAVMDKQYFSHFRKNITLVKALTMR